MHTSTRTYLRLLLPRLHPRPLQLLLLLLLLGELGGCEVDVDQV